jgi:acetoin utilization deacetylase AcuC-like enzyme
MKVIFHEDYYQVYTGDPAAASGRMESIVKAIDPYVTWVTAEPATRQDIAVVHTEAHIQAIVNQGLFDIAALAAGGAIKAAQIGLSKPCFGLIRPPGHHASAASCWGFCFFNNMAVALTALRRKQQIETALVLDIDLHYGDGTVNILGKRPWVTVVNYEDHNRTRYLEDVANTLENHPADVIAISAGFDNHVDDWGGLLQTVDYEEIGRMVRTAAQRKNSGYFAILEGGYNHDVLGDNVLALIQGLREP